MKVLESVADGHPATSRSAVAVAVDVPLFSVCIPQFNRTRRLLLALDVLQRQTFRDFEVCISDDVSNDGMAGQLREFLDASTLRSVMVRQPGIQRRYHGT